MVGILNFYLTNIRQNVDSVRKARALFGGDRLRVSLYEYCLSCGREDLLSQWDKERNAPLTPKDISYGSKQKVWWRCEKGHSWQAAAYTRTSNSAGCPYCTGRWIWPGENDLASKRPDLAAQWHPTKNGKLLPEQVMPGSNKKVWWICDKGHEWQATVKSRSNGTGCPVCCNRKLLPGENDLATTYPALAKQWHPQKNGRLTPRDVTAGSRKKVWWICKKGHEWQAMIALRTRGTSGCPVCAGKVIVSGDNDLAKIFPEIAAQWHPTLNGNLTPEMVSPYSNRKVWWQCELGHAYFASVSSRTMKGSGCPYCSGKKDLPGFNDLATVEPAIAAQWHPTLNGSLTPSQVTVGSKKKVWWLCPEGHSWQAVIYSRTGSKKCGCPVCMGRVKVKHNQRYIKALQDKGAWPVQQLETVHKV